MTNALGIAIEQVMDKALEVAGFGDVHGWAGRFMRLLAAAHLINTRFEKHIQDIVFIGGHHQLINGQAH